MKRTSHFPPFALAALIVATGCNSASQSAPGAQPAAPATNAAQPAAERAPLMVPPADGMASPAQPASVVTGKVLETMDTAGYTYVRLQPKEGAAIWAAGPQTAVKVGDEVTVSTEMPMENYHSSTLNRTFDVVYFAGALTVGGQQPAAGAEQIKQAHGQAATPAASVDLAGIEKAAGGYTVGEVYEKSAELAGKPVVVRAKVVKFTPRVMGKNWIHVRDGSGTGPTADLTVTTMDEAAVGDLVVLTGTLAVNQDFGSGYSYPVLVQDAKLEPQPAKP